jgi:hypothetical protein
MDVPDMHSDKPRNNRATLALLIRLRLSSYNLLATLMTQREKLLNTIRQNPKAVRFDDACKIAGWLGFIHDAGQGSHRVFKRPGEPIQLNFQNRNGFIPPYQAQQLIAMLDKYGE